MAGRRRHLRAGLNRSSWEGHRRRSDHVLRHRPDGGWRERTEALQDQQPRFERADQAHQDRRDRAARRGQPSTPLSGSVSPRLGAINLCRTSGRQAGHEAKAFVRAHLDLIDAKLVNFWDPLRLAHGRQPGQPGQNGFLRNVRAQQTRTSYDRPPDIRTGQTGQTDMDILLRDVRVSGCPGGWAVKGGPTMSTAPSGQCARSRG